MGILAASDRVAGAVARAATTLGQLALVALGVHLAADQLDDQLVTTILAAQAGLDSLLAGPAQWVAEAVGMAPESLQLWDRLPVVPVAASAALVAELAADTLLAASFVLTQREPVVRWRDWRASLSVQAIVLPVALAGVLVAGAWSMSMAVEDVLPLSPLSQPAGAMLGLVVLARFGVPAWKRAVAALEPGSPGWTGALTAALLVPMGGLAWVHGVPIWGLFNLLLGGAS
jgi:hypothetical protein